MNDYVAMLWLCHDNLDRNSDFFEALTEITSKSTCTHEKLSEKPSLFVYVLPFQEKLNGLRKEFSIILLKFPDNSLDTVNSFQLKVVLKLESCLYSKIMN